MKKILSILCALSILMSVLIIPSAFTSVATETTTTTALVPSSYKNASVDEETGTIYSFADWSASSITFDYVIESGYNYILTYDYKGGASANYGQPVSASTVATSTTNTLDKVNAAINLAVPESKSDWTTGNQVLLNGDELLKSGGTYLAINALWVDNGSEVSGAPNFKNITIEKVAEEADVLYPQSLHKTVKTSVLEGEAVYTGASYGSGSLTFDYVIEEGYTYYISFDYKGGNYADTQPPSVRTVATSLTTFNDNNTSAISLNVTKSTDAYVNIFRQFTGEELLASGGTYLAIGWVNMSAPNFKNFRIAKEKTGENIHPTLLHRTDKGIEDGAVVYTNNSYDAGSLTYDYQIEKGATYLLTYDYKGTNGADMRKPSISTTATNTTDINGTSKGGILLNVPASPSAWKAASLIFTGDELIEAGGGTDTYFAICWQWKTAYTANFKNIKLQKIEVTDQVIPTYLKDFVYGTENGELYWQFEKNPAYYDFISFNTGVALEANKKYVVSFDYKYPNGGINGGNRIGFGTDSSATSATSTDLWSGQRFTNVPFDKTEDWTEKVVIIDTSAEGFVTDTYKYLTFYAQAAENNFSMSFKNLTVAELNSETIIPTALKVNEMSFGADSERLYWYTAPTGDYQNPTFSTDYVIEAGKKYAVTFDYKYTGSMAGGMEFGVTDTTTTSNYDLIKTVQTFNLNTATDWTEALIIFDTTSTDVITDTFKYFAFYGKNYWGRPELYFSNLKITEITVDSIIPSNMDKFVNKIEDGAIVTNYTAQTGETEYSAIGINTDFQIESGKEYVIAFDYKFTDFDGGETCWLDQGVTLVSTGTAFDENRRLAGKIKELFNNEAYTAEWKENITVFSTENVDETNKYLGIYALAAPNKTYDLSFKNINVYNNGDVNFDNIIDTSDIVLLKKTLIGADAEGAKHTNISADDDNATNIIDLVAMKKILVSKEIAE